METYSLLGLVVVIAVLAFIAFRPIKADDDQRKPPTETETKRDRRR
jgi:hypothetical protein